MMLRDDIRLAAYAVSLGYSLHPGARFTDQGDPVQELTFRVLTRGGDRFVDISLTSMGWRIFEEEPATAPGQISIMWKRPDPAKDFFKSLKKALEEGVKR